MTENASSSKQLRDRAALEVELAELMAQNEAAASWGAAVGARHERIKQIQSTLRYPPALAAPQMNNITILYGRKEIILKPPLIKKVIIKRKWWFNKIEYYVEWEYATWGPFRLYSDACDAIKL